MKDTYCQIFVDADINVEDLEKVIALLSKGEIIESRKLTSAALRIYISKNNDADKVTYPAGPDVFLCYPYYLEIDPVTGVSDEVYIASVGELLTGLRSKGWRSVPACEFEHELPWSPEAPRVEPPSPPSPREDKHGSADPET